MTSAMLAVSSYAQEGGEVDSRQRLLGRWELEQPDRIARYFDELACRDARVMLLLHRDLAG